MLNCNGCKNRNTYTYTCSGCIGWNRYESSYLINPVIAMNIDKKIKMLAKASLNISFGVKKVERKTDMRIKKLYFNKPVTVVLWEDGTKTIVRSGKGEEYDPEKGLAMAIAKKALGNKGNYYEVFKKWLPEDPIDNINRKLAEIKDKFSKTTEAFKKIEQHKNDDIQWLTVKKVSDKNGVSVAYVLKEIKNGSIMHAKKVKGKWMVPCLVFDDHVEIVNI